MNGNVYCSQQNVQRTVLETSFLPTVKNTSKFLNISENIISPNVLFQAAINVFVNRLDSVESVIPYEYHR